MSDKVRNAILALLTGLVVVLAIGLVLTIREGHRPPSDVAESAESSTYVELAGPTVNAKSDNVTLKYEYVTAIEVVLCDSTNNLLDFADIYEKYIGMMVDSGIGKNEASTIAVGIMKDRCPIYASALADRYERFTN